MPRHRELQQPMNPKEKAGYAIGYGKPPAGRPFQKGQPGNPRGRRRDARNLTTSLRKALDDKVVVTDRGRRRRIAKRESQIGQLVAQADPAATKLVLDPVAGDRAAGAARAGGMAAFRGGRPGSSSRDTAPPSHRRPVAQSGIHWNSGSD
jgi:Family of unknown function (DUF5681)